MGVHFNRIVVALTSNLVLLFLPSQSLAQAFTLNSSSQDLSTVASGQVVHFTAVLTANQNLSGVSFGNQIHSLSTNETIGENWVSYASIAGGEKITLTFAFTVPAGTPLGKYRMSVAGFLNSGWTNIFSNPQANTFAVGNVQHQSPQVFSAVSASPTSVVPGGQISLSANVTPSSQIGDGSVCFYFYRPDGYNFGNCTPTTLNTGTTVAARSTVSVPAGAELGAYHLKVQAYHNSGWTLAASQFNNLSISVNSVASPNPSPTPAAAPTPAPTPAPAAAPSSPTPAPSPSPATASAPTAAPSPAPAPTAAPTSPTPAPSPSPATASAPTAAPSSAPAPASSPAPAANLIWSDEFTTANPQTPGGLNLYHPTMNPSGVWRANDFWMDIDGAGFLDFQSNQCWYINPWNSTERPYTPFEVSNGTLKIYARHTPSALLPYLNSSAKALGISQQNFPWISGWLTAYPFYNGPGQFTYGYVEARMRIPTPVGMDAGFWLYSSQGSADLRNKGRAEVDIIEEYGDPHYWFVNLHNIATDGTGPSTTPTPNGQYVADPNSWHTYGIDWKPDYMGFYQDGVLVFTRTGADATWFDGVPMRIMLNFAVNYYWFPAANQATSQTPDMTFEIDYVRLYRQKP